MSRQERGSWVATLCVLAQHVVDMNRFRYPDDPDVHMAIGKLEEHLLEGQESDAVQED